MTRLVNILARFADALDSLDAGQQPTAGLQLMSAAAPFEPNPTVPTLVYGIQAAGWPDILGGLRSALPREHDVWLLSSNGGTEHMTLASLGAAPLCDGLYVPALAPEAAERSVHGLRHIVHRLRTPGGCPWDREQTHESLARYVIEEAYEVVDAIHADDTSHGDLAEELGDLLLQVFLQAELAEEAGRFNVNDVVERISTKLIRRHPHVFGDVSVADAAEVERNWDRIKGSEKAERTSVVDGIPRSLPALMAAQEIQKRLKKSGFDWPDRAGVSRKLTEELAELRDAPTPEAAATELGDVLFMLARTGLDLGADAEAALRCTNDRVTARFRYVEARARGLGTPLKDLPTGEQLRFWDEAKAEERSHGTTSR